MELYVQSPPSAFMANLFSLIFIQRFVGADTARTNVVSVVILPKFYGF